MYYEVFTGMRNIERLVSHKDMSWQESCSTRVAFSDVFWPRCKISDAGVYLLDRVILGGAPASLCRT